MQDSALAAYKALQRESWGLFSPMEIFTTIPAANLVKFSLVSPSCSMLDVGCGTGVVAITAAKLGINVSALDLSPVLLERARTNIAIAAVNVDLKEGDAESIAYPDHSFDAVLSQFGHIFAPRPEIAIKEMLRVLKSGGTIAFSSWPPDLFTGRLFSLVSQFSPPPLEISPPSRWGNPHFVREQLGNAVEDLTFDQGVMMVPALSLGHYRQLVETTVGPVLKFVQDSRSDPVRLKQFRDALEVLASQYFSDNHIHQHYLMCRARKK